MPRLTVRAFAELMQLPAYEQVRILTEQKYPRKGAGQFKIPFYQPAMTAIRRYYASGNDAAVLTSAVIALQRRGGLKARIDHNVRAIDSFRSGRQATRRIVLLPRRRHQHSTRGVDVRLVFDLVGVEKSRDTFAFYNFRAAPLDPDTARTTLELAHWVLEKNGMKVRLADLQYIDLHGNNLFQGPARRRSTTVRRANQNAAIITTLWPTL